MCSFVCPRCPGVRSHHKDHKPQPDGAAAGRRQRGTPDLLSPAAARGNSRRAGHGHPSRRPETQHHTKASCCPGEEEATAQFFVHRGSRATVAWGGWLFQSTFPGFRRDLGAGLCLRAVWGNTAQYGEDSYKLPQGPLLGVPLSITQFLISASLTHTRGPLLLVFGAPNWVVSRTMGVPHRGRRRRCPVRVPVVSFRPG